MVNDDESLSRDELRVAIWSYLRREVAIDRWSRAACRIMDARFYHAAFPRQIRDARGLRGRWRVAGRLVGLTVRAAVDVALARLFVWRWRRYCRRRIR